jgi:hypothetical protein
MGAGFLISLLLGTNLARADLGEKFQEELSHDPNTTPLQAQVLEAVQARPSVMIAGIMNEWIPGYFADNAKTLKKDFGQKDVRRLFPSSQEQVEANAPRVDHWIRRAYKKFGERPLMVFAHSKGGNEVLLAALKDPSLIRDGIIDRLILIQSAMRGSHIADLLLDNDAGNYPAAQPFHWLFHGWKGLWSMTTREAGPTMDAALAAADPADVQAISDRLFWVRGVQTDEKKCSWQLQAMHYFVNKFYGESDGVMLPADEMINGLGTDLGVVTSDHFDITERNPGVVATPESYRRAFTRALMRELFE